MKGNDSFVALTSSEFGFFSRPDRAALSGNRLLYRSKKIKHKGLKVFGAESAKLVEISDVKDFIAQQGDGYQRISTLFLNDGTGDKQFLISTGVDSQTGFNLKELVHYFLLKGKIVRLGDQAAEVSIEFDGTGYYAGQRWRITVLADYIMAVGEW